jgi:hypothetical protein
MKAHIIVLFVLLASVSVSFAKPRPRLDFKILSTKKHILYFKVNRAFIGGVVEVYDQNKTRIESDELPHTHSMIYFDEAPAGYYTIKIKKNDRLVEFKYKNN